MAYINGKETYFSLLGGQGATGDGVTIWQTNRDYSSVVLGGVATGATPELNTIPNKTPKVNDYVIDNLGNLLRIGQVVPMVGGNLGLKLTMASLAAVDKRNITLGLHTDGLIYIFIDGVPTGNGIALPSGASGDVVGNVDSANNIVLSGNLADGTYTVKYEMEDGSTVDIGGLVLGSNEPAYTNLAEPNADNTTDFTIWCSNARMGGDGSVAARDGYTVTNYISLPENGVFRVKNFKIERVGLYDSSKTALPSGAGSLASLEANGYILEDYVQTDTEATFARHTHNTTISFVRLSGWVTSTAEDVIITVNQEITE